MSDATKEFPTADVLSVVTGRLVAERGIGAVYEVLNWMTGENLMTHQLPRVSREAEKVLLALRPDLASAIKESDLVTPENWHVWRDEWVRRYGPLMVVPRMTADQHERIDPISELAEKVHPSKIVVVGSPQ